MRYALGLEEATDSLFHHLSGDIFRIALLLGVPCGFQQPLKIAPLGAAESQRYYFVVIFGHVICLRLSALSEDSGCAMK
jgi:hypothetical protein